MILCGCLLQLILPADEETSKLQRVREAMELFTTLVTVDLTTFMEFFEAFLDDLEVL